MDQSESSADAEIRHLVIVGHDVEPTQHVQELLLQERESHLSDGLRLLRDVAPQAEIFLTVPRSLVDWARDTFEGSLNVFGVSDEYRRRLVRMLVAQLTGIAVPPSVPYRSRGVAVMSVETALAAQDALEGRPFVRKTVTVSGRALSSPLTVRAPLGTSVKEILAACGLDLNDAGRVLAGGPMSGVAIFSGETPLCKFQHGIHLLDADELPGVVNRTCVNCGRCVRACPVHLQVNLIGRCVEFDQLNDAGTYHPEACLECGLCAFVCPAGRPLVQLVNLANRHLRRSA